MVDADGILCINDIIYRPSFRVLIGPAARFNIDGDQAYYQSVACHIDFSDTSESIWVAQQNISDFVLMTEAQ